LITAKVERRELLLGGAWRDTAQRVAVRYPYTGEVVAEVADAGPGEVEAAIDAAVRAFPTTRSLPAYRPAEILLRAAAAIQERAAFLARQIVFETGNPIGEAQGEVARTAAIFQMAGEEAKRIGGEIVPIDVVPAGERRLGEVRRFPIGPVVGITAFNAPL